MYTSFYLCLQITMINCLFHLLRCIRHVNKEGFATQISLDGAVNLVKFYGEKLSVQQPEIPW